MKTSKSTRNLSKFKKYKKLCEVAFENGALNDSSRRMLDLQADMFDLSKEEQKMVEEWFNFQVDEDISENIRYKFLLKELKENEHLNILDKENIAKKLTEIDLPELEKELLENEILNSTIKNYLGIKLVDESTSEEYPECRKIIDSMDSGGYPEQEKSSDSYNYEVKERIKKVLKAYNIKYKHELDIEAEEGPTVTRFSLELVEGEKLSKIQSRIDDITRELGAPKTVSVANVPGTFRICFDVPKSERVPIPLSTFLRENSQPSKKESLEVGLGINTAGKIEKIDLLKTRHLLVGGTTGSGKSVFLQSMIISLISLYDSNKLKLIIVDPKQLDFSIFEGLPHLEPFGQVTYKSSAAENVLIELIKLMEMRKKKIKGKALSVKAYNEMVEETDRIPYVVVVIDEYADFLMSFKDKKSRNSLEQKICRIAQVSRALGMRLVLATQRPEANIVTGLIKANFPARIALTVRNHVNSSMIIDVPGAENLLGHGDMLYSSDGSSPRRLQGFFIDQQEIKEVVELVSKHGRGNPLFSGEITKVTNPFDHLVLPIHDETPLTLKPGETAFLYFDAVFLEPKEFKEIKGPRWHLGVGKRVSKGMGVGAGVSFGTRRVVSETKLDDVDTGTVVLTNQRIVFLGDMFAEECKYSDIIDYQLDDENLLIFLSSRRKAMCFTFSGSIFISTYMDDENPLIPPIVRTSRENIDIILESLMYLSHDPGLDNVKFNKYEGGCVTSIPRG